VFGNARTRTSVERCATMLARHGISINRAYLDLIKDPNHGVVTYVGFVVQGPDKKAIDPDSTLWTTVRKDLTRVKWVHYDALEKITENPELHIGLTEITLGLSHLVHKVLNPRAPFEFTLERIKNCAWANLPLSMAVALLFKQRFDPRGPMDEATFDAECARITTEIERTSSSETSRTVLLTMVDAIRHVLRTNYHVHGRFGFAVRLDPEFLRNDDRPALPYGVFFVHGRGFDGFHVRFQDIARGGLRVVMPRSEAQHGREAERLYDEVYGLAFAQQLKNKDIPEGGAKAAILLEPGAGVDRCVKAFVNSLLDLITPDPETRKQIVDLSGLDELIYLGPDENITPDHIEWVVRRAALRGYPLPTAFMSSKPGAGINHKVYGVTSEGVNVFLDVALNAVGIDPRKQPFTVKITGGPDGDVAGNMIRILDRDYGDNAKVVAIGDGSGCAEDPDGFDTAELMRLFEEALPIASYDRSKLGPRGSVHGVDEPDGAQLRNTIHNRVVADAFVPAGGRPATIHAGNWKDFLQPDGTPSAKVISEGANLFLTPEARERLSEAGCVIVKDSSANKCGVICSSFEICACMVLEESEFLEIKPVYVDQVLTKLRELARLEAELLINEHERHPETSLPETSTKLSRIINAAAPAIAASIADWSDEDLERGRQLVRNHLPPILLEVGGDRVWARLPERYLHWMMANRLASGIVYREGIDFLDGMEPTAVAELAVRYLRKSAELQHLLEALDASDVPERDKVARLLERGGIRALLHDI
jgi:glutamate dehydrogenase